MNIAILIKEMNVRMSQQIITNHWNLLHQKKIGIASPLQLQAIFKEIKSWIRIKAINHSKLGLFFSLSQHYQCSKSAKLNNLPSQFVTLCNISAFDLFFTSLLEDFSCFLKFCLSLQNESNCSHCRKTQRRKKYPV